MFCYFIILSRFPLHTLYSHCFLFLNSLFLFLFLSLLDTRMHLLFCCHSFPTFLHNVRNLHDAHILSIYNIFFLSLSFRNCLFLFDFCFCFCFSFRFLTPSSVLSQSLFFLLFIVHVCWRPLNLTCACVLVYLCPYLCVFAFQCNITASHPQLLSFPYSPFYLFLFPAFPSLPLHLRLSLSLSLFYIRLFFPLFLFKFPILFGVFTIHFSMSPIHSPILSFTSLSFLFVYSPFLLPRLSHHSIFSP